MAAGPLSHRIDLVGVGRVSDGAGGFTRADTAEVSVFAEIRPASAQEVRTAERNELRISHMVRIRWRSDLLAHLAQGSRARWVDRAGRTRELRVQSAYDPDERGRWLILQCLEGGPL